MKQLECFDYHTLDIETREFVLCKERTIKARVAHAIIETGNDLISVKERLPHGSFTSWVSSAFGMSKERAAEYMRISSAFKGADSALLENFSKSSLLLLSSKDTPDEAREEALDFSSRGQYIGAEEATALKEKAKRLEQEREILEQKYLESEKDRIFLTDLKTELETRVELLQDMESAVSQDRDDVLAELADLRKQMNEQEGHLKNQTDTDCAECRSAHPHCDGCCLVCQDRCNANQVCRKPVKVVHHAVEVPVEKIPEDYHEFRIKSQTLMDEIDTVRSKLDKEREVTERLQKETEIQSAVTKIETGIQILSGAIRTEGLESWEIPLVTQYSIIDVFGWLSGLCTAGVEVSDQSSREKLLRAGYTILRASDESRMIKIYSGKGSWKKHSEYETQKEMRRALSDLLSDEKTVMA